MLTFLLHRMANIQQLLGQPEEAIKEYTAVLQIEPSYVPALKGKSSGAVFTALKIQRAVEMYFAPLFP